MRGLTLVGLEKHDLVCLLMDINLTTSKRHSLIPTVLSVPDYTKQRGLAISYLQR